MIILIIILCCCCRESKEVRNWPENEPVALAMIPNPAFVGRGGAGSSAEAEGEGQVGRAASNNAGKEESKVSATSSSSGGTGGELKVRVGSKVAGPSVEANGWPVSIIPMMDEQR